MVESEAPLGAARHRPIDEEYLRQQLGRLGNTPYELAAVKLEIAGAPFAPSSMLNQLRRDAVDQLQAAQGRFLVGQALSPANSQALAERLAGGSQVLPPHRQRQGSTHRREYPLGEIRWRHRPHHAPRRIGGRLMKRRRLEQELERDIADHIAMETEDNLARGMSPSEARFAALRKFGNIARVKEDTRSVWAWTALDTWFADIRHALRRMRRSPGTAALAVLSLALAFAPSVTIFSVMDRLFLTPLPIRAPGEIVEIQFRDTRPNVEHPYQRASYADFQDFRSSLKSFSGLADRKSRGE